MARKRHSDEDVLKLLREIELKLTAGDDVASACQRVGISDATYYNWRKWVWRDGSRPVVGTEKPRERERAAEEDCRRARTGQAHPQGRPEPPKAQGQTIDVRQLSFLIIGKACEVE
ncbi:transposase [Roseobacter sp. HKCCD9010]|uniref:transposase n=1 Tax=unclassified Roseobacter TaxID=196798 RepID=UPI001491AE0B|nr:transposase [Rhodobacterales bacterium HKCCD4356]NNV14127.1 transposase [Roseobacter sp. HKCCD7357]NNV18351.1 transposase [Roseobacter sp. HKCCD8768]NNV27791.1 transposase [Roseobacter sp. HKCCD8192]NNV32105.1 transposase [Roseobacter sp. HKCCD9061]NNV36513.1 transposase [Roseobacter sp. HKCCD9073]NNV40578.1 transposase [Roseobacter sp. HKCCD9054]NNV44805.1 transposase [Roseobacter sp. HKCCD6497]NNV49123.1 transposase [Roseobacter sp. HKCCD6265]NNV53377.1 transposase [Roseobacter sp. HK